VPELERARELGAAEQGLAVAITMRADGRPRASVVNAGVLDHPVTGEPIVGFVSRGAVHKLADLRRRPEVTVVFRSGWEWIAVEGDAQLMGPADPLDGVASEDLPRLLRTVYAAAAGGNADDWAPLDESMAAERQTAVLVRPVRVYPTGEPAEPQ
jgi:PPOX class probable F420-dependent enzyme